MAALAIVPALGPAEPSGADLALLDLAGRTAIERVVETCLAAGAEVIVIRAEGAPALPQLAARTVSVAAGAGLDDGLRAAAAAVPPTAEGVAVFPVDQALVEADTLIALFARLTGAGCRIARPVWRGRLGQPLVMTCEVTAELAASDARLADVLARDPDRVAVVPTANRWVGADLARPEELRAARCALAGEPWSTTAQMIRHRSRRAFGPEPLAPGQLERLVDAARHASTSSYIQAYSVVAVSDQARKATCAALCGGQAHIEQAPVFLAVCADLHKLAAACGRRGSSLQTQSFELFLQATIDAALLGQNLQLASEAEGLGGCMIGGARNNPVELAELLGLPPHVFVVFGLTMGTPADDPVPRGRMPLGAVLHRERYDAAAAIAVLDSADDLVRQWGREVNARQGGAGKPVDESKGWTDRMARTWGEGSRFAAARQTLTAELRRLGFGLESV